MTRDQVRASSPNLHIRHLCRNGTHIHNTARLAPGYQQANIAIIPESFTAMFQSYCRENPRPCPILAISTPGDPKLDELGHEIDIRTDLPAYEHYKSGRYTKLHQIRDVWRSDYVTFALGCSFTFDQALERAGIEVRHKTEARNVPMYITNVQTTPVGIFSGPLVVSMRPIREDLIAKVLSISSRYQHAHGAPIHIGNCQEIGISDINSPDFGDPVSIYSNEVPAFWACGVTPRLALEHAGLEEFIVHSPGCMLVTDMKSETV